jgi:adenylate cyclase class IV
MQLDSFYELELKALLTEEKYNSLLELLSKNYTKVNDDIIYNKRYRPGDIRLRYSNRVYELVKKELLTDIASKKIVFKFEDKEEFEAMQDVFDSLQLQSDPISLKHNQEFHFPIEQYAYTICLQDIKNFTYFIEIKIQVDDENFLVHELNIKSIFKKLNLEPTSPKELSNEITKYILKNKKLL